jgi:hypothetical protein
MPLYFFRIRNGRYSGASEQGIELADHNAAWQELTSSCAQMVGGMCRKLGRDTSASSRFSEFAWLRIR